MKVALSNPHSAKRVARGAQVIMLPSEDWYVDSKPAGGLLPGRADYLRGLIEADAAALARERAAVAGAEAPGHCPETSSLVCCQANM